MAHFRVYTDAPLSVGQVHTLTGDRYHYIVRVLRCRVDDDLTLFNGSGVDYAATLIHIDRRAVSCQLTAQTIVALESPLTLHLAQGLCRQARMDWVVQKAVELGVHTLTPIVSDRTLVALTKGDMTKRQAHWQSIVISACEQSGRSRLPAISAAMSLSDFLAQPHAGACYICQPASGVGGGVSQRDVTQAVVLVGPESGFTTDEVGQAQVAGFAPWQLGPRTLRTETAGLVATSVLQYAQGDLGPLPNTTR